MFDFRQRNFFVKQIELFTQLFLIFDFVTIFDLILMFNFSLLTNYNKKNNFDKSIFNTLFNSKYFVVDKICVTTRIIFNIFAKKIVYYRFIDFQLFSIFNIEIININNNNFVINSI